MSMSSETTRFESWAIVELMGHIRVAGKVTIQEIAGQNFIRVDIPGRPVDGKPGETAMTKFYGASAIYCLTPVAEGVARAVATSNQPEPLTLFEMRQLTAPPNTPSMEPLPELEHDWSGDEDEDDFDEDEDEDEADLF